ncbi:hypothetical protein JFT91_22520 [Pseudomonas sp. TH08]|uniref:hypothetical protein n=1 Tax=Pseudomonas sp. TH08 TaxID=2796374 RepID=UPI001914D338|nr:hypothetical protein [Pseudomonas sp. TH08]MBK5535324.1 hypothetical protein [Pseudomonas sp. TH08]
MLSAICKTFANPLRMHFKTSGRSRALKIPSINNQVSYLFASSRDAQAFLVFPVMELAVLHALRASLDFRNAPFESSTAVPTGCLSFGASGLQPSLINAFRADKNGMLSLTGISVAQAMALERQSKMQTQGKDLIVRSALTLSRGNRNSMSRSSCL